MYDENDPRSIERYSSAITLSDMELFIFPELLYSLVLANSMSPRLWRWRSDPWFDGMARMSPTRRVQRLKQYIIDHFSFNLDLDTWGLTTKETELARFSSFIKPEILARSNALFGYEGDTYYFDTDIRRHFGLDKYTSNVIPYWKTETIEAMEAFKYKPGYPAGAGECVSLSTLYAAAAFAAIDIPLDDIFLMATPLHSQNYFDIGSGILSNNRRIVTKAMWFNGTELSGKARRALENEEVTIVAHRTGYIHTVYPVTTIDPQAYRRFGAKLRSFLSVDRMDIEVIANFLRFNGKLQRCFQIKHTRLGKERYIEAEKAFAYEHNSKARVSDETRSILLAEIEEDDFYTDPIPGRLVFDELEDFFKTTNVVLDDPVTVDLLKRHMRHACYNIDDVIPELIKFCRTSPRLPGEKERYDHIPPIDLSGITDANEAQARVEALRLTNETCDLAFAAFRDLSRSPWKPFLKAALERNPVSVDGAKHLSIPALYERLSSLPDESIYDESVRIAQPDEVWNFGRGDGIEKAILLANVIRAREPDARLTIEGAKRLVRLVWKDTTAFDFPTQKTVTPPEEKDF